MKYEVACRALQPGQIPNISAFLKEMSSLEKKSGQSRGVLCFPGKNVKYLVSLSSPGLNIYQILSPPCHMEDSGWGLILESVLMFNNCPAQSSTQPLLEVRRRCTVTSHRTVVLISFI